MAKIGQVLTYKGLERESVEEASAGDIVAITGIENVTIGDRCATPRRAEGLPPISVDEPTIAMNFQVNTSPLAGREGKYVTSRQMRERLYRELQSNVALRVEDTDEPDVLRVLRTRRAAPDDLIENMRREGYELAVSRPQVLTKIDRRRNQRALRSADGRRRRAHQGAIMEALGSAARTSPTWPSRQRDACASSTGCRRAASSASRASS